MKKTNGILHLLLQLSNDPNVIQSERGTNPVVTPAQGSVLESVFSSKLANQVAYRAAQNQSKNAEMAADQQTRSEAIASTRQRQLDYLRTLRFNSP